MNHDHNIIKDHCNLASSYPLCGILPGWYFRVIQAGDGRFIAEGRDIDGRVAVFDGGETKEGALKGIVLRAQKEKGSSIRR
jgi:hypothetical protein